MSEGTLVTEDADVVAKAPPPLSMDIPVSFSQEKALELISDQEIEQLTGRDVGVNLVETNSEMTDIGDYVTSEAEKAVRKFYSTGKCCKDNCITRVNIQEVIQRREQFEALEKEQQDFFLMGQFLAFEGGHECNTNPKKSRTRRRLFYRFNTKTPICQTFYHEMYGIGNHRLHAVRSKLYQDGIEARVHGNTGRPPKRKTKVEITLELTRHVCEFIKNFALTHQVPGPSHISDASGIEIYLSPEHSKAAVYRLYKAEVLNNGKNERVMSSRTFIRLWNQLLPQIKVLPAKTGEMRDSGSVSHLHHGPSTVRPTTLADFSLDQFV
ncbi:hypothetical protein K493DRAFT_338923 [Basidiobolus meristosporus CBS 931.73]|uniref:Uncharacterized protein n=1 Tax=Basidiobolus meristosporus CBS 931.73 TaxID=1314790 RepID=A0A1Y1Y2G4_9FUNG|nr:hypothetical protein K493DRAFT_338923 [Basidiobolus meristosporus CBS 931.73]|eukprot:ORX92207.1 hypothetical protein K493DRAFT_338923 [Basidiobolus meristosporus CBS 931.73]